MKTTKTKITMLFIALLMCVMLVPAVKAEAAVTKPATPGGLGLYDQEGSEVIFTWNLDTNLNYYSDAYPGVYGYEIVVSTLKNKQIATLNTYDNSGKFGLDGNKVVATVTNSKMKTQGFKFKVRSYVYDENTNKVYSNFSKEKIIIPRATVTKGAMKSGKVKISWKKVSGAKSYTIYLSSNNGKKFKKLGTTKKSSYTISKKLTKYKDYYVYVQANSVKYKGKKYNSTKPTEKRSNAYKFYIYTVYR